MSYAVNYIRSVPIVYSENRCMLECQECDEVLPNYAKIIRVFLQRKSNSNSQTSDKCWTAVYNLLEE